MINNPQIKKLNPWLRSIPAYFVGIVLISTGIGKALDVSGFASVLEAYQLFPDWLNIPLAFALPCIELGIGICLLMRLHRIVTACMAVALHIIMLSVVIMTLNRGIEVSNCGCFGVFFARPLTTLTAIEDFFMLGMSLLILFDARHRVGQQNKLHSNGVQK